jgi:hypothetical protein
LQAYWPNWLRKNLVDANNMAVIVPTVLLPE